MHILNKTNIDFMRWRWHAVALSWIVILAGLGIIMTKGLPRGIEFAGGTSVLLQFDNPPSDDAVREALNRNYPGGGQDAIVQAYGAPSLRTKMVRVPHVGEESGASLSSTSESVEKAIRAGNLGNFTVVGTEIVGPAVGKELSQRGLIATVLSLVGLLAYIAFRYQLSFAVGAVVATIHDLLVVVAFLAFFRYDLTLNVIAAILTVTGYSTNDTIVIFDRVRENLRGMRKDNLMDVINASIQPDARSNSPDRRLDAPQRRGPVPVRRRSPARIRLHDDHRHHHRHLLEHLRRGCRRHLLARCWSDARGNGGSGGCWCGQHRRLTAADAQGRQEPA
ncbi:MAG: protein translocase subunit SecF [Vicinamibacterales bacterium]